MPSFPVWNPILEAAEQCKLRCLLDDNCVLAPGEPLWTDDYVGELTEHLVEDPLVETGQSTGG